MQALFTVAFGVGLGYTIITTILGNFFDIGDTDVSTSFNPLRPAPISAFLIVFGGFGILLYERFGIIVVVLVSAFFGFLISYLIIRFVIMPLHRAQNTSTIERQNLIGIKAIVNEKILQDSFGKISYHVNGSSFSSPAKSENGDEIPLGTDVEIVSIESNTYFVKAIPNQNID